MAGDWLALLMEVMGCNCCTKRDDGLLHADDETNKTLRMRRQSFEGSVERQSLIADHFAGVKSFADDYEYIIENALGTGSFGTVRKAYLKSCPSIIRAVKELRKVCPYEERNVRREVLVLRNLDHPNICKLFETFEDETHFYLVMELITGRALLDEIDEIFLGHHDERWNKAVMRQLFDGLRYCHNQGVIHRDLKLENIMCDSVHGEPHITLIDFGMAVAAGTPRSEFKSTSIEGTQDYMAPEVLRQGRYSTASDMWSAGIILFILFQGQFPDRTKLSAQIQSIGNPDACELLRGLLHKEPWLRMSADGASKHTWTNGESEHDNQCKHKGNMEKTMTSMLNFYRCDKLQKAALTAVASQLCGRQLQHMRQHFQQLDSDGNGVVTKEELVELFEANPVPSIKEPRGWVGEVFDQLDSDGSGELEFTEFQAAVMQSYVGISEETMQAAFHALDADNSGTISHEELGRLMRVSSEEVLSYMKQADLNGDGVLDFGEFKAIFASLPVSLGETGGTYDVNC